MSTKEAFETLKQAMIDDNPHEKGSYAHSWHCNIAMCCYDAIKENFNKNKSNPESHFDASLVANDAASRFMRQCFDVETSQ